MKLSIGEVTVLGYSGAGWSSFQLSEKALGNRMYRFENTPLEDDASIYYKYHKEAKISLF